MINLYWSETTERLKEIMIRGGNSKLKKYGGGRILQAINSQHKDKVIYDYIVQNERDFATAMIQYKQTIKEIKDPKTRVISLILSYFFKRQIMERSVDAEIDIIQKNIEVEFDEPEKIKKNGDLMVQYAIKKKYMKEADASKRKSM